MSKPSADEIQDIVRKFVAAIAQMNVGVLGLAMGRRNPPLRFDGNKLVFLDLAPSMCQHTLAA